MSEDGNAAPSPTWVPCCTMHWRLAHCECQPLCCVSAKAAVCNNPAELVPLCVCRKFAASTSVLAHLPVRTKNLA